MATSMADLGFNIDSSPMRRATGELDRMSKGAGRAEKSAIGVTSAYRALGGALAALGAGQFVREMVRVNAESQKLQASLKTVTGSIEAANSAWKDLENFARTTPFALTQSIQAFTKMKALGLDPTIEALTSFGNTASAMGKDLNQMIEAVADAATGEFERLKEFGIRAKQQGDEVSFIFQGVETTVAKNAASITEYLQDIGNVQFAGAMAEQMDTLGGQLSNLGDSMDSFFRSLGAAGGNQAASIAIESVADSINTLSDNAEVLVDIASVLAIAVGARLAGSVATATGAMIAAQVQSVRYQAALASMAGVSRVAATSQIALAGAVRGASAAMALLGGPAGVALLAAGSLYYFRDALFSTEATASDAVLEIQNLGDAISGMTLAQAENGLFEINEMMAENAIKTAEARIEHERLAAEIKRNRIETSMPGSGAPISTARSADLSLLSAEREALLELEEKHQARIKELRDRQAGLDEQRAEAREKADQERLDRIASAEISAAMEVSAAWDEAYRLRGEAAEDSVARIRDRIDPVGAIIRELDRDIAAVNEAYYQGIGGIDSRDDADALINRLEAKAKSQIDEIGKISKDSGDEFVSAWEGVGDRVGSSLQNAIASGDWSSLGDSIGGILASSASNKISGALSASIGGSMGALIGPIAGGIAGGAIQLAVTRLGDLMGGGFVDPTESRQRSQGTGTVFGDLLAKTESISESSRMTADATEQLVGINRDLANALTRTTAGAGEVAGIAGGFASEAGLSQMMADAGFEFGGGLNDAAARLFADVDFLGGANADLKFNSPELTSAVQETFNAISDSVTEAAQTLGIDASAAIDQYVVDFTRVSLEGLSAEESKAEIERVFGVIFDELAEDAVPFLTEIQNLGEGLGETLTRVATSVQSVEEAAAKLSVTFSGDAGVAAGIVEAAGGLSAFNSAMSQFQRSFLSESEVMASLTDDLSTGLGRINQQIPDTRQGFADLLREQLASDNQNEEAIATLLRLQGAADQYYTSLEQAAQQAQQSMMSMTDSAMAALSRSVQAQRDAAQEEYQARVRANEIATAAVRAGLQAIQAELGSIQQSAGSLRDAFGPMQAMRRASAIDLIRNALTTGDLTGTGDASKIAANVESSGFQTRLAFEREQAKSLILLTALEEEGENQLTTAEQSLKALERQSASIDRNHRDEMSRLDGIIDSAQEQIDAIRGVDNSILSLSEAIANLSMALESESQPNQINDLYQSLLGRDAGATGQAYWQNDLASGQTIDDVSSNIQQSPEFKIRQLYDEILGRDPSADAIQYWMSAMQSGQTIADVRRNIMASEEASSMPAFANGGMHAGGLRMVGERGPEIEATGASRIMSNNDLMKSLGASTDMLNELRSMRADLKAANRALVKSNEKQRELLQRWDQNGLPEERAFV